MTSDRPDDHGDYGYDLAHEGIGRPGAARPATDPDPAHHTRKAPTPTPDGDYGYDEAHGY